MRIFLKAFFLFAFCWAMFASTANAQDGAAAFKKNACNTCHNPTDQKKIGPGLKGVVDRWGGDEAEIIKFIQTGAKGYAEAGRPKSAYVADLIKQFAGVTPMAPQPVSEEDAKAILTFLKNPPAEPGAPAGGPVAATGPAPVDDSVVSGLWVLIAVLLFAVIALIAIIAVVLIAIKAKETGTPFSMNLVREKLGNISRNAFLRGAVGFLIVLLLFSWLVDFARGISLHQGYNPVQPIAFSHVTHAGQYEIDCEYCHVGVRKGKSATIPSTNICQNCHNERGGITQGTRFGEAEIGKVLASGKSNKPIEWVRIHNLPDLVYFNHSQHTVVAGLECETCHGPVKEMEEVYQYNVLSMGWCVNCHRQTEVDVTKSDYYRSVHSAYQQGVEEPITVEKLGGLNCARCHY